MVLKPQITHKNQNGNAYLQLREKKPWERTENDLLEIADRLQGYNTTNVILAT